MNTIESTMDKKYIFGLTGLLVVIGGIIWWGLKEDGSTEAFDASVTTYFFGEECPHCRNVRAFLSENKIEEKFSFVKREVWHDRNNARLMRDAAAICNLGADRVAVPFVFSEGKCTIGEPQVIDFFKQKAGM